MCILIEFDTILDKNKNNIIGQKGFVRALIVSFTECRTANAEIRRKKNANNYEQLNCRCVCDVKGRTPLIPTDLTRSMPTDTHTIISFASLCRTCCKNATPNQELCSQCTAIIFFCFIFRSTHSGSFCSSFTTINLFQMHLI